MLERFRREARAAARLHHTNIVPVFEVGREGDVCYYAMQFIQGQGLDLVYDEIRRLRGRPKDAGRARVRSGQDVARASSGLQPRIRPAVRPTHSPGDPGSARWSSRF